MEAAWACDQLRVLGHHEQGQEELVAAGQEIEQTEKNSENVIFSVN